MSDERNTIDNPPVGAVDATGQPATIGSIIPPEQPPMDDAAGPDDDTSIEETSTDDLTVQGGD